MYIYFASFGLLFRFDFASTSQNIPPECVGNSCSEASSKDNDNTIKKHDKQEMSHPQNTESSQDSDNHDSHGWQQIDKSHQSPGRSEAEIEVNALETLSYDGSDTDSKEDAQNLHSKRIMQQQKLVEQVRKNFLSRRPGSVSQQDNDLNELNRLLQTESQSTESAHGLSKSLDSSNAYTEKKENLRDSLKNGDKDIDRDDMQIKKLLNNEQLDNLSEVDEEGEEDEEFDDDDLGDDDLDDLNDGDDDFENDDEDEFENGTNVLTKDEGSISDDQDQQRKYDTENGKEGAVFRDARYHPSENSQLAKDNSVPSLMKLPADSIDDTESMRAKIAEFDSNSPVKGSLTVDGKREGRTTTTPTLKELTSTKTQPILNSADSPNERLVNHAGFKHEDAYPPASKDVMSTLDVKIPVLSPSGSASVTKQAVSEGILKPHISVELVENNDDNERDFSNNEETDHDDVLISGKHLEENLFEAQKMEKMFQAQKMDISESADDEEVGKVMEKQQGYEEVIIDEDDPDKSEGVRIDDRFGERKQFIQGFDNKKSNIIVEQRMIKNKDHGGKEIGSDGEIKEHNFHASVTAESIAGTSGDQGKKLNQNDKFTGRQEFDGAKGTREEFYSNNNENVKMFEPDGASLEDPDHEIDLDHVLEIDEDTMKILEDEKQLLMAESRYNGENDSDSMLGTDEAEINTDSNRDLDKQSKSSHPGDDEGYKNSGQMDKMNVERDSENQLKETGLDTNGNFQEPSLNKDSEDFQFLNAEMPANSNVDVLPPATEDGVDSSTETSIISDTRGGSMTFRLLSICGTWSLSIFEMLPSSVQTLFEYSPFSLHPSTFFSISMLSCATFFIISLRFLCKKSNRQEKKSASAQVAVLQKKLLAEQKENDSLQQQVKSHQAQMKDFRSHLDASNTQAKKAASQISAITAEREALQQNLILLGNQVQQLSSTVELQNQTIQSEREQTMAYQQTNHHLSSHISYLEAQMSEMNSHWTSAQRSFGEMQSQVQCMTEELTVVQTSKDQLQLELETWKEKFQKQTQKLNKMHEEEMKYKDEIKLKELEIQALHDCYANLEMTESVDMRSASSDMKEAWKRGSGSTLEEENEETRYRRKRNSLDAILKSVVEMSEVQKNMKELEDEKCSLKAALVSEKENRSKLEAYSKDLKANLTEEIRKREEAEKKASDASNKVNVLSNYFQEKELELTRRLSSQEDTKHMNTGSRPKDCDKTIEDLEAALQHFKNKSEILQKEMQRIEAEYKKELLAGERKANENWLLAHQKDREATEFKNEAEMLKLKIEALQNTIDDISNDKAHAANLTSLKSDSDPSTDALDATLARPALRPTIPFPIPPFFNGIFPPDRLPFYGPPIFPRPLPPHLFDVVKAPVPRPYTNQRYSPQDNSLRNRSPSSADSSSFSGSLKISPVPLPGNDSPYQSHSPHAGIQSPPKIIDRPGPSGTLPSAIRPQPSHQMTQVKPKPDQWHNQ